MFYNRFLFLALPLLLICSISSAGPVSIPNTFVSGEPTVAAEVNSNFSALETSVNDNHSRLSTAETTVSDNASRIAALESQVALLLGVRSVTADDMVGNVYTLQSMIVGYATKTTPSPGNMLFNFYGRVKGDVTFSVGGTCVLDITDDNDAEFMEEYELGNLLSFGESTTLSEPPSSNACTYAITSAGLLTIDLGGGTLQVYMTPNLNSGVYTDVKTEAVDGYVADVSMVILTKKALAP